MKIRNIYMNSVAFVSVAMLGACSATSTTVETDQGIPDGMVTLSNYSIPNADGSFSETPNFATTGTRGKGSDFRTLNGAIGGYAFQYGTVEGTDEFLAVAGVARTTEVGRLTETGTVTYSGEYQFAYVGETTITSRGDIVLEADFGSGTLTGSAANLNFDGDIAGRSVGGTATFNGVEADIRGVIGDTTAVAAFQGRTDDAVLVGGIFVENPQ